MPTIEVNSQEDFNKLIAEGLDQGYSLPEQNPSRQNQTLWIEEQRNKVINQWLMSMLTRNITYNENTDLLAEKWQIFQKNIKINILLANSEWPYHGLLIDNVKSKQLVYKLIGSKHQEALLSLFEEQPNILTDDSSLTNFFQTIKERLFPSINIESAISSYEQCVQKIWENPVIYANRKKMKYEASYGVDGKLNFNHLISDIIKGLQNRNLKMKLTEVASYGTFDEFLTKMKESCGILNRMVYQGLIKDDIKYISLDGKPQNEFMNKNSMDVSTLNSTPVNQFEKSNKDEKNSKKTSKMQDVKCYRCHKVGHIKKDCRVKISTKNEERKKYCKICNKTNHYTSDCYKQANKSNKYKGKQIKILNPDQVAEENQSDEEEIPNVINNIAEFEDLSIYMMNNEVETDGDLPKEEVKKSQETKECEEAITVDEEFIRDFYFKILRGYYSLLHDINLLKRGKMRESVQADIARTEQEITNEISDINFKMKTPTDEWTEKIEEKISTLHIEQSILHIYRKRVIDYCEEIEINDQLWLSRPLQDEIERKRKKKEEENKNQLKQQEEAVLEKLRQKEYNNETLTGFLGLPFNSGAESMLYNIVRGNLCNLTMDLTLMLSKASEEEKTSCYAIRKKLEMLETVLNNRKPDLLNYQEPSLFSNVFIKSEEIVTSIIHIQENYLHIKKEIEEWVNKNESLKEKLKNCASFLEMDLFRTREM